MKADFDSRGVGSVVGPFNIDNQQLSSRWSQPYIGVRMTGTQDFCYHVGKYFLPLDKMKETINSNEGRL
jgi:hypothetical protein